MYNKGRRTWAEYITDLVVAKGEVLPTDLYAQINKYSGMIPMSYGAFNRHWNLAKERGWIKKVRVDGIYDSNGKAKAYWGAGDKIKTRTAPKSMFDKNGTISMQEMLNKITGK